VRSSRLRALPGLLPIALLSACAAPPPQTAPPLNPPPPQLEPTEPAPLPVRTGEFDAQALPEASGLALSRRDPELLWLVDDAPGTSELWAVRPDGAVVARVEVAGLDAVNAESLASGPCAVGSDEPCLYVGDTGDNVRAREHVRVVRLTEPDLADGAPKEPVAAEAIELRYPEGPEDSEALLVDEAGVPHLVTKPRVDAETGQAPPPRLFAAPGFADGTLTDLGPLPLPPPPLPMVSLVYGNVVTGADSVPGRVLLRTYDHLVELRAPSPDAPLSTLPSWDADLVPAPQQPQPEAVAYDADGCGYWLISERVGDIWHVPCAAR
jgi:hypothetical protein